MPTYSASDAFLPAIHRTKALLFQPFRFGFWCRLALLGLLTGELSSNGCSFNGDIPRDLGRDRQQHFLAASDIWQRLAPHFWLIVTIAAIAFILLLVFMYIGSRCRFMLFEAVLDGQVRLRPAWCKWKEAGTNFFLLLLTYTVIMWGLLAIFIGLPLLIAYLTHFSIHEHLLLSALGITLMVVFGLAIVVIGTAIFVLTKDFAVPIMALEGISIGPALRKLAAIISAQKVSFLAYIGMKILITIGAGIAFGLGTLIVLIPFILMIAIIAGIAILIGASAGLTWTPATIALAVALGVNAIIGLSVLITFGHTPLAAFFPSYALLFFAGRYAPLHDRLFPPPTPPVAESPSPEPPPEVPPEPALG